MAWKQQLPERRSLLRQQTRIDSEFRLPTPSLALWQSPTGAPAENAQSPVIDIAANIPRLKQGKLIICFIWEDIVHSAPSEDIVMHNNDTKKTYTLCSHASSWRCFWLSGHWCLDEDFHKHQPREKGHNWTSLTHVRQRLLSSMLQVCSMHFLWRLGFGYMCYL